MNIAQWTSHTEVPMNTNKYFLSTHFDNKVKIYPIDQDFITLGKGFDTFIPIADQLLEERHCRIENKDSLYVIKDLRTSTGTYLNGSRIIEAILQDGDKIKVGARDLTFHLNYPQPQMDSELKSRNAKWQSQLTALTSFAKTNYPVLILGPSGSGKEIIARKIHENSERSDGPFVTVNCSALTETLIESELFGHIKGSYTGAIADRKGAFESARGGTLFLDEIGDLPISLQAKLLRALENKEIRPVGADKVVKTDVRIISATHQKLRDLIEENKFRSDLYFRLNVIHFQTPALNERMEDFEDIFYALCRELKVRFNFEAIQTLKNYSWPGNIRELKNIIARAAAMFSQQTVTTEMIDRLFDENKAWRRCFNGSNDLNMLNQVNTNGRVTTNIIKEIERQMILTRLEANKGNQRRTATDLGIPKSTLHDRIKTYKIDLSIYKD